MNIHLLTCACRHRFRVECLIIRIFKVGLFPSYPWETHDLLCFAKRCIIYVIHFALGCAVFATFFIHFEANLSKYGSCSLHIRMFRNIRKHHLFASFASYSLQNICTDSHTNIRFDAKNTCCSKYLLQNEYLLKTFSYWRILCFKIFV
jgi:hypothetical protein